MKVLVIQGAGEVVNALYDAHDRDIDAALINPAGYRRTILSGYQECPLAD